MSCNRVALSAEKTSVYKVTRHRRARLTGALLGLALLAAPSAHAVSVTATTNYVPGTIPSSGDAIIIDLYLTTDPGLQLFSVSSTASAASFEYVPLPVCGVSAPTVGCGAPSYILYSPGPGGSALYPLQDPWQYWPSPPTGLSQVNVNFYSTNLSPTVIAGTNVWIATIAWVVTFPTDLLGTEISVSFLNGGNVAQINSAALDPSTIPINGSPGEWSFTITPEPTTGLLLGLGLTAIAYARRRVR